MNEIEHSVTTFIEENKPCDSIISIIMEMKSRYWKDDNDKIVICFKNNPIDFTRIYEKITQKEFGVEDEAISDLTETFFSDEVTEKSKKYADFFNKMKDDDPSSTFLMMLLGFIQSGCTWGKEGS